MSDPEQKTCDICHEQFPPDRRTVKRQHICDKLICKREHQRRYHQQWRANPENADYFRGRYAELKAWLKQHPDYLKNYRAPKNNQSKQKSCDIQIEITPINNNKLKGAKIIMIYKVR